MRYMGLVRSGDVSSPVMRVTGSENRVLPGGYGMSFVTGFVSNLGGSQLSVNFYVPRRETQEVLLGPGETLEVRQQPADQIQFTANWADVDYLFKVVRTETGAEAEILLAHSEIKKKKQGYEDYAVYPEIRAAYLGRVVGDEFQRTDINPAGFPELYRQIAVGDASHNFRGGRLQLLSGTGAASGVGLRAGQTGIQNTELALGQPVRRITLQNEQIVVLHGHAQGGLYLSDKDLPEIHYNLIAHNVVGFQIDTVVTPNYEFTWAQNGAVQTVDTDISITDNPYVVCEILHHSGDNSLEAALYAGIGRAELWRRAFPGAFPINYESLYFVNISWANKRPKNSSLYIYNWTVRYS